MKRVAAVVLTLGCLSAGSLALSTIHPWGDPRMSGGVDAQVLEGSNVTNQVRTILEDKCGNCHSERTKYPIYSHLAPVSWMIENDVQHARGTINLSRWQYYSTSDRINALTRVATVAHNDQMPPRRYLLLHPEDHLSQADQQLVYDWAKSERKRLRIELSSNSTQSEVKQQ